MLPTIVTRLKKILKCNDLQATTQKGGAGVKFWVEKYMFEKKEKKKRKKFNTKEKEGSEKVNKSQNKRIEKMRKDP